MQRRPVVRPLGGAEVLVAVRGPSPGEGEGKTKALVGKLLTISTILETLDTLVPLCIQTPN